MVNQAPERGRHYWLVLRLDEVDPTNPHSEYYGKFELASEVGVQTFHLDFDKTVDPGQPRTIRVYSVDSKAADYLREDADSGGQTASVKQRVSPPCQRCVVSNEVAIKLIR